ncbi:MAG: hypothetical protein GY791_06390 [Alphaproteobacteria bacterium]|nr:hypothetical protein [Alphaproteobacteria bacterium]
MNRYASGLAVVLCGLMLSGCASVPPDEQVKAEPQPQQTAEEECTRLDAVALSAKFAIVDMPVGVTKRAVEDCSAGDIYACVALPGVPFFAAIAGLGISPLLAVMPLFEDKQYHRVCASKEDDEEEGVAQARKDKMQDQADNGSANRQWYFAVYYAEGPEQIDYLCRSAKQGYAPAQYYLGSKLNVGDYRPDARVTPDPVRAAPVTPDPVRAYMWYTLAVNSYDKNEAFFGRDAVSDRNALSASMTPDQIAGGERLVAAWTSESPCP